MQHLFDLHGKTALVTGASSGMGKAIAEALGTHGAQVIVSSNEIDACRDTVWAFQQKGIIAHALPCDLAKASERLTLYNQAIEVYGIIDILVSCVSVAAPGPFLDINEEVFTQTIELNLHSALHLSQLFLPGMQTQKDGVIIFLASIASVRGNKSIGLYGITKAGIVQMARNLAVEFGPDNIRVNAISPGLIDTPFSKSLLENPAFMERRLALTPLRRVGTPEEIAGLAVLLASPAGAFITGQNLIVDGGTTISDGN
jgi:NAD(P)-dependent dehydrogenase (short-subunit alcohol dehydrogenase family)